MAKCLFLVLPPGGTIVGAPFGGYAPFGHPPSAVLPPPRHAAFYPQPILYWGYPSPPVSPTTYYSAAPPGTPHHLGPPPGHQAAGIPAHSHAQPTMLALSPDQRSAQRSANQTVSLVTLPPRAAAGTAGSPSSGESSSSSPPLLSPTGSTIATSGGGCSSSGSVTSVSSGTAQRHGAGTIRTSPPPTTPLLSLPLAASASQPLAIPAAVTTPTAGGLAGAYPGSQLSPIQAMAPPPPSVHFPHASLMGTASPPGAAAGPAFYDPHPHLSHHHHHPSHHHHHHHHHPHHAPHLTHHHHDKLVTTAPSILTPSLIPNQYVELFIV